MSAWYQSKVKYGLLVGDKVKDVAEIYLHEACDFGEVETQCKTHLQTRIKRPKVNAIAESTHGEVIFYRGTHDDRVFADPFFHVGMDTGEKYTYLIPAKDAKEAMARAIKAHGYGDETSIFELKRTLILAVWHPHNELWQGDWWNRMDILLEAKKHSWDIKPDTQQEDLFNDDGTAKQPAAPAPDFKFPELDEATRIAAELAQRKMTTPALRNKASQEEPVAVEAEDLENGSEPEEEFHQAKLIEAGKQNLIGPPSRKRKPKTEA